MPYSARKIYLNCDEQVVETWAEFMRTHLPEVRQALTEESVERELWFSGNDDGGLFVIGVMNTDDMEKSKEAAEASTLEVDRVHGEFKQHWAEGSMLAIDALHAPEFPGCRLLFDITCNEKDAS